MFTIEMKYADTNTIISCNSHSITEEVKNILQNDWALTEVYVRVKVNHELPYGWEQRHVNYILDWIDLMLPKHYIKNLVIHDCQLFKGFRPDAEWILNKFKNLTPQEQVNYYNKLARDERVFKTTFKVDCTDEIQANLEIRKLIRSYVW